MSVSYINPPGLSKGTYSHTAVVTSGKLIFISGQVATDAKGQIVGATFAEQARQVFENLKVALAAEVRVLPPTVVVKSSV